MFILPANKLLVGLNKTSVMITLVKIDPEFRRNPAGIPARTNQEFQVDSRWNPLESSGIIAGILQNYSGIPPES